MRPVDAAYTHRVGGRREWSERCPDCGRWLATYRPDGTFDLAAHAGVVCAGVAIATPGEVSIDPAEPLRPIVGQATCYRRRCRLARWLRSKGCGWGSEALFGRRALRASASDHGRP